MLIRQEGTHDKIVEIRKTVKQGVFGTKVLYCINLREVAGDWPLYWEIRQDGTRSIMCEFRETLEEANKVFDEYMKKAAE